MTRTREERAHSSRLGRQHSDRQSEVFLEIEREVFGSDYGATSWTGRDEAKRMARWAGLAPGVEALEVGAGSGWPGVYLARRTGCSITLADVPRAGLRIATRRAAADGLSERCAVVVASGASLPFTEAVFDAVIHCDVLC